MRNRLRLLALAGIVLAQLAQARRAQRHADLERASLLPYTDYGRPVL